MCVKFFGIEYFSIICCVFVDLYWFQKLPSSKIIHYIDQNNEENITRGGINLSRRVLGIK
jgi:hypothetical protein